MSNCINNCRLCRNLVLSQAITFDGTSLVVNLPEGSYGNGCKYCIVLAQAIPVATTITAPVVFTIGTDTTEYPFLNKCCQPILANQVRTRRLYSTRVATSVASGVFKYVGDCCLPASASEDIASLPITPATPADGGGAGA